MPRMPKHRFCREDSSGVLYKPRGIPADQLTCTSIELDEFEAMRLCDLDGKDQTEAGDQMGVSRGTIQRLLESGRKKLLQAVIDRNSFTIGKAPSCCEVNPNCQHNHT